MNASPGLRERKKQRTRQAIADAAHALFVTHGYAGTTLNEIAEAADVSTRTLFSYYGGKEDILFANLDRQQEALAAAVDNRPAGEDTLDAVYGFVMAGAAVPRSESDTHVTALISGDPALQALRQARLTQVVRVLTPAIAEDLHVEVDNPQVVLVAACLVAGLGQLIDAGAHRGRRLTPRQAAGLLDPVFAFIRAALAGAPSPRSG